MLKSRPTTPSWEFHSGNIPYLKRCLETCTITTSRLKGSQVRLTQNRRYSIQKKKLVPDTLKNTVQKQVMKTEPYHWGGRLKDRKHLKVYHASITPTSTQLCYQKSEVQNRQHTRRRCRHKKIPTTNTGSSASETRKHFVLKWR